MKRLFVWCVMLIMSGCTKDNVTPTTSVQDNFDPSKATLLKHGTLMGIGHTASGEVSLYDDHGMLIVLLDPYASQNGPDLKVYLSKDINASEYLNLGKLKAIQGKQTYVVPASTDITKYSYVHIWCEQFTVVFGRAEIK